MKILYFDCAMGAAGDMLSAALLGLFPKPEVIVDELNNLRLDGISYQLLKGKKQGISGYQLKVICDGEIEDENTHHHHDHHHYSLDNIKEYILGQPLIKDTIKEQILTVYNLLARAESEVHGETIEHIHFHEVGSMDAIGDITAFCYLVDKIDPDKVLASPINVGSGFVKCAHGILPVPAPATANLLKDVPIYSDGTEGELCTPTGAALLKAFVTAFEKLPTLLIKQIGYGLGQKDFPKANCLRAILAENTEELEEVVEINFNIDDMTGEEIAYLTDLLLQNGANEVYTTAINMKKNRPGILISIIAKPEKKDEIIRLAFKHSTTLGLRITPQKRYLLDRKSIDVKTAFGTIRRKDSKGYDIKKSKYEFDDLSAIAKREDKSIFEIRKELEHE